MSACPEQSKPGEHGSTLVEVLVAALLVAIFFASIFEINAMCLRYIGSSKEALGAVQLVNDRAEALRNRSFIDLTRTNCDPCVPVPPNTTCVTIPCVHDLMATAANQSPFASKATEVVRISKYPTADGVTQYTRSPSGSVTTDSVATTIGTDMVKVEISVSWTTGAVARSRTEQTTFLVANGSKK